MPHYINGYQVLVLSNGLLAQLAPADQVALMRKAELIQLKVGEVLPSEQASASKIYFPLRGSIALYVGRHDHAISDGLAIGLIGAEGAVGLQAALGFGAGRFQLLVQSPGEAYVVNGADAERLVQRRSQLLLIFSRYLWSVYENIATLASQANAQDIKARLACWILLSASRCGADPLVLTHAQIAKMLGVRRASISIAAKELKVMRYINYSRGRIEILNDTALEALVKI